MRWDWRTLTFTRWEDRYVAETTRRNVQPGDDLRVALPEVAREETRVETADTGETFFVVDDFPASLQSVPPAPAPRRIGIAWDASLSRAEADRDRDLGIIAAHLARLGSVEVEAVVFRNVADAPRRFSITQGKADALLAYLREQPCDGATNLAAVRFPADASYSLLFSDGLATVGGATNDGFVHPVFILSGDPRADHAQLRAMAQRTGGRTNLSERPTPTCPATREASSPSCRSIRSMPLDLEPAGPAVTGGAYGSRGGCSCRARAWAPARLAGPAAARDANDRAATPSIIEGDRPRRAAVGAAASGDARRRPRGEPR